MNKSMRFLSFTALIAALAVAPAAAATTATLSLSGSVPAVLEISVSPTPEATSLPLTSTVGGLEVATVVERSNKKAGYTVSLESASAKAAGSSTASLVSGATADKLAYSIAYGGNAVSLVNGYAVVSTVNNRTGAEGISRAVTVSFDGAAVFLDESVYSDTLTFTISAK